MQNHHIIIIHHLINHTTDVTVSEYLNDQISTIRPVHNEIILYSTKIQLITGRKEIVQFGHKIAHHHTINKSTLHSLLYNQLV